MSVSHKEHMICTAILEQTSPLRSPEVTQHLVLTVLGMYLNLLMDQIVQD